MQRFSGTVQRGERRGVALGFPTANISLGDAAERGIYAATVVVDDAEYQAAVFVDEKREILEAHLLDFSGDLYGKTISVKLCNKIRDAAVFSDTASLVYAFEVDVAAVRS